MIETNRNGKKSLPLIFSEKVTGMELSPYISLGNGWYDLEHDGQRYFRWSSLRSDLNINSQQYDDKVIEIHAGSLETESERFIALRGANGSISHNIVHGWNYYIFPLKKIIGEDSRIYFDVSSQLNISDDTRELGVMVSAILLVSDKDIGTLCVFSKSKTFGDIKVSYLQKINITKGDIIFLNQEGKFIVQNKIFLDITYESQEKCEGSIKFMSPDFLCSRRILCGGERSISLEIPADSIGKSGCLEFKSETLIDIKNIIIRRDYYDFFGLRSGEMYDGEAKKNEQKTIELSKEIGLSIQWFVTWKCTYRCRYCWQESESEIYRREKEDRIPPETWADKFNKLNPKMLYFTGGEPSLYKELPVLINLLSPDIMLMMTSNLGPSFDVEKFAEIVNPKRFKELTFSFHPTQQDFKLFFSKLRFLADHEFENLQVEMVLYPENMSYAEKLLNACAGLGILVRFDPCISSGLANTVKYDKKMMKYWVQRAVEHTKKVKVLNPDNDVYYNFEKSQFWSDNTNQSGNNKDEDKLPMGRNPIFCPAGMRRINIDSQGNVYVCMSAVDRSKIFGKTALPHYAPIGNILSEDFTLLDRPIICWESSRCSACDFQVLDRAWTKFTTKNIRLPLPE